MSMDVWWIAPRLGEIKLEFYEEAEEFIMAYVQTEQFTHEGTVRCPSHKYKCRRLLDIESIRYHLYKDEFKPDYWVWIEHGEVFLLENQFSRGYVGSQFNVGYVWSRSTGAYIGNEGGGNVN